MTIIDDMNSRSSVYAEVYSENYYVNSDNNDTYILLGFLTIAIILLIYMLRSWITTLQ